MSNALAPPDPGVALAEAGRVEEAMAHWRNVLARDPRDARAHHNLGVALAQQGQPDSAAESLQHAIAHHPRYAEAHFNLGNILLQQRKRDEALAAFRKAIEIKPDYFDAYVNLGSTLTENGKSRESVIFLQHAIRLRPQSPEAHNNLGLAFADQGRWPEAEAAFQEALRLKPEYAEAHNNLASAYNEQGKTVEAEAAYQIALWLQPDAVSTHWNRALAWLQAGDYERGWPEYEWRWKRKQTPPRRFPQPTWDGSPLEGRTILLHTEQGLGDMLQFVRFAAVVKARGGTVIVQCPGFLIPLFQRTPGVDRLVDEDSPLPAFDVYAPFMSLPGLTGTTLATVPATVPYLFVDPERAALWKVKLQGLPGFKIGIAWQGNPHHAWDHHRSFPLELFAPIAAQNPPIPGGARRGSPDPVETPSGARRGSPDPVETPSGARRGSPDPVETPDRRSPAPPSAAQPIHLISLQKGPGSEQLTKLNGLFAVHDLGAGLEAHPEAYLDTAALMLNLDLVISADTATAHLAGGLGVKTWIALSAKCDWRWLFRREDSPWYPSLRLFRQQTLDDWPEVFARMADALTNLVV
jgi:Tfp pilus assembly protein PilF